MTQTGVVHGDEILIVCEDAGGAAALAPVARMLSDRGDKLTYLLGPVAERALRGMGLNLDPPTETEGASLLTRVADPALYRGKAALLEATSCWGLRIEAHAAVAARAAACPSLGVLDFWSNYAARLSLPGPKGLEALPDLVAVIDSSMRDDLTRIGISSDRIEVTGSPAFDALLDRRAAFEPQPGTVLFLSQPIAALFGADATVPGFLGYTERSVLLEVASSVREANGLLLVRPHPREDALSLAAFVRSLPCRTHFAPGGTLHDAVLRAAVVVGMTTVALVEAALLGAPVISAQLGRLGEDPLPTSRAGLTKTATDTEVLRQLILSSLTESIGRGGQPAPRSPWTSGATNRVLGALDALVARARATTPC